MRENFTLSGVRHISFLGFRPKSGLAWLLLKMKENRVDSVKDFPRVHELSAKTKLNQENL